ncbi:unnamed protein product [Coregonus sp. 'balchen']|nr:unnamed protein product [Coregonus sp. 'balchen']
MMKFAEPLESQRLSFLLEKAASREAQMWKAYVPKKTYTSVQDTDISPAQRDEAVYWLIDLHSDTKLYPETLSLAISILDRFLGAIKARPKYLRCIAIACYFLAAKSSEEDEHLSVLTQQLHYCLADSTLLQPLSRGSMLALALITLELENICPDWLALTILLLSKAQIDSSQLIRCRELVSRRLSTQEASLPPNTVYIYQPLDHSVAPGPCDEGEGDSNTRLLSPVTDPPAPAPRDRSLSRVSSTTALLQCHGPPMPSHHPHQVHLRCKLSAKRKGGRVKNSELLAHFKTFLRDHENQTHNRQLFKKFVNSVAVVKPEEGVSYVVLRKKCLGQVAGDIAAAYHSAKTPARQQPAPQARPRERDHSPRAPVNRNQERGQKGLIETHFYELHVPPGDTNQLADKVLASAGIVNNNNNVETTINFEKPIQSSTPHVPDHAPPPVFNREAPFLPSYNAAISKRSEDGSGQSFEAEGDLNHKGIYISGSKLGQQSKEPKRKRSYPPPEFLYTEVEPQAPHLDTRATECSAAAEEDF